MTPITSLLDLAGVSELRTTTRREKQG